MKADGVVTHKAAKVYVTSAVGCTAVAVDSAASAAGRFLLDYALLSKPAEHTVYGSFTEIKRGLGDYIAGTEPVVMVSPHIFDQIGTLAGLILSFFRHKKTTPKLMVTINLGVYHIIERIAS